ncbi:MAG: hypothetical protein ACXWF8_12295 [Methylobacter sp.]
MSFGRCYCPNCGKEQFGSGRLGTSRQCGCGARIDRAELDKARHYWLFQIAVTYAAAAFFLAMALFYRDLPDDPWRLLFNPMLQAPAMATLIVGYRIFVQYKRTHDNDDALMRFFQWGIGLMSLAIAAALLAAMLG